MFFFFSKGFVPTCFDFYDLKEFCSRNVIFLVFFGGTPMLLKGQQEGAGGQGQRGRRAQGRAVPRSAATGCFGGGLRKQSEVLL